MLTYGSDPEVFSIVNGEIISPALLEKDCSFPQIDGDVKHPIYIQEKEFHWMGDGAAWEVTFKKPFTDASEIYTNMQNALNSLNEFLNKLSWKGEKVELFAKPVAKINPKLYVDILGDETSKIYWGFVFGCDADEEAILENYSCKTISVLEHAFRYGGGHWHIGESDEEKRDYMHLNIIPFIQIQAILLGNISIANSKFIELEKMRSETYGTPGRYRMQKWGTEYRTPSNSWITNKETIEKMVEGSEIAFELLENPSKAKPIMQQFLPDTIKAIKNSDQKLSRKIISNFGL